jgi:hypothetical protein
VIVRTQGDAVTLAQSGNVPSGPTVVKLPDATDDLYVTTGYPVNMTIAELSANQTIGSLIIPSTGLWDDAGRGLTYNTSSQQWKSGPSNYNGYNLAAGKGFKIRRTSGSGSMYFKVPKPY